MDLGSAWERENSCLLSPDSCLLTPAINDLLVNQNWCQ